MVAARRAAAAAAGKSSPLKPQMSAYSRGQRRGALAWKHEIIQAALPYIEQGWGLSAIGAQLTKDGFTSYNVHHGGAGNAVGGGAATPRHHGWFTFWVYFVLRVRGTFRLEFPREKFC